MQNVESTPAAPKAGAQSRLWLVLGAAGCAILLLCLCGAIALALVFNRDRITTAFARPTSTPTSIPTSTRSIPTPTPAKGTPPPAGRTPTPTQGNDIIVGAVMATDVEDNSLDPVGITDTFAPAQKIFYAIVAVDHAPANTTLKAVWLDSTNTNLGDYEIKTQGSRNLQFTFKPDAPGMPVGKYTVQIYLNGKLNRTLAFSVSSSVQPVKAGIITKVTLAEDASDDYMDPVNPTTVFKPEATFHAVVAVENAPANTKVSASWYVIDVGSTAQTFALIDSTDLTTSGTRNLDFTLAPKTSWPVGKYQVDISVNGSFDRAVDLTVK